MQFLQTQNFLINFKMAGLKGKQNVRAQKNLWYVYGFNVGGLF